jgi:uncharacterized coiled-coil DUF342 family protein
VSTKEELKREIDHATAAIKELTAKRNALKKERAVLKAKRKELRQRLKTWGKPKA